VEPELTSCHACGFTLPIRSMVDRSQHGNLLWLPPDVNPDAPGPGDVVLCHQCAAINIVTLDHSLRPPFAEELIALESNPELHAAREPIARARGWL
jgi:hypothetical protein